ncbi:MAG: glycoside hydrolase family 88 protein [Saprospiraceae bacterium]
MNQLRIAVLLLFLCATGTALRAQEPWSVRMAATLMATHPDSFCYDKSRPARWDYELGLYLKSLEHVWRRTGNGKYYQYIRQQMDLYVQDDGSIRTYREDVYNIDHITPGRAVLLLWQQMGKEKYKLAAQQLRKQIEKQPRTKEGGFWHKKRYPWQMWLDGLYMGEPFYAEYSLVFDEPKNFDDIANQFIWMEQHARDPKSGLLYHGWDESREQAWADKATGLSPNFWGRAMGWYSMALVDVLDYLPKDHPKYGQIVSILQRLAEAVVRVQDQESGVWYQVLDKGDAKGNYLEASASCMFSYALLKGVRLGYLDGKYLDAAQKAYAGILKEFMVQDTEGFWHLDDVCSVAGLGGNPYRDGSFEYYISEPQRRDDLKGAGPFILASIEMERLEDSAIGKGKTVLLDRYFNNEYRKSERFHYIWEDTENSGYSWWGQIFSDLGAGIKSLDVAPTSAGLQQADVYIIVDPDTRKETAAPHVLEDQHIREIGNWIENGGTLVLFANDTSNCEITRFNRLAGEFGIRFSDKNRNMVVNNQFEQGAIPVQPGHAIFSNSRKLYIKEISVLDIKSPARAVLSEGGDVIMAFAPYGKGRVFALGDPWLYNEYVDGRKLPGDFDNFTAARDLAEWLLKSSAGYEAPSEEIHVAEAVEYLRKALVSGDHQALETITSENLSYGHSGGKVENRKEFVSQLVSGRSNFIEIMLTDQTISVEGNTAIVRHRLSAKTDDAGKGPGTVDLSILLVWIKENGDWKLLARQAVKK